MLQHNIPKSQTHIYILIKMICWPAQAKFHLMPSQAMSCLTYTHIRDTLAFAGYLKILLCLLWLYRHFASWAMSHRHRLLRQCQNTALPSLAISLLYLLSYLPLGLLCLSDYFCLLGYFASWATLPLGLYIDTLPLRLCLIDIVCFGNVGILICLLGYFNMLPPGPCLIDIVCFDNAGILICLLGCAIAGHLLVCKNDKIC
jgi:hypothetical protein